MRTCLRNIRTFLQMAYGASSPIWYPGEQKHLGDPRECVIDMTAGGGEADRSLSTGIREGVLVLESRLTPYLSHPPKATFHVLWRRQHCWHAGVTEKSWTHQDSFMYLKFL